MAAANCPLAMIFNTVLKQCSISRVRQIGLVVLQDCLLPPMTHISVYSIPILYNHGPTIRPRECRWPNKARARIMRSDSPLQRERPGLPPVSVLLGISSVQRVTQPFGCPMAAGWQLRKSWIKDGLVSPASCFCCPSVPQDAGHSQWFCFRSDKLVRREVLLTH